MAELLNVIRRLAPWFARAKTAPEIIACAVFAVFAITLLIVGRTQFYEWTPAPTIVVAFYSLVAVVVYIVSRMPKP